MTDANTMVERLEKPPLDVIPYKLLSEAAALIRSQQEENAVLREALEPFAKKAGQYDQDLYPYEDDDWATCMVGDLRRARAAGRREG